jgi:hypothetical protein
MRFLAFICYLLSPFITVPSIVAVIQFFNLYSGVQLGSLGTASTNRPIALALGDYDDGETGEILIGRGNRSIRRKPATVPLCPPQSLHAYPDENPGRRAGKPATNSLSCSTAVIPLLLLILNEIIFCETE